MERHHLLMNLALDGQLTEDEQFELENMLRASVNLADDWEDLNAVDVMLHSQARIMVSPPRNFAAGVMERIATYEEQRRWQPWLIGGLIFLSVLAALNIAFPVLFFSLRLYRPLIAWPVSARIMAWGAKLLNVIVSSASLPADWLERLTSDPATLAVVLTALVLASTWIGLREGLRLSARKVKA